LAHGKLCNALLFAAVAISGRTAGAQQTAPSYPQVSVGGLWYLSYQDGEQNGADFSRFVIKRGYINVEAKILSFLAGRITPDTTQDSTGDVKVRLKYAYAKLTGRNVGFITKPELEFGIVHMAWLDFEERVNRYRLQDTMFMERVGLFNSADFGFTATGLLGGTLPEEYQSRVTPDYPGRYGSFALGMYNGGGYHAREQNENKVLEGRLTVRPLPDIGPGFQISYLGIVGKGNTALEPDFNVSAVMASYQSARVVLTGTWMTAAGNQSGDALAADGSALERDGWSVFGEGKVSPRWGVIARYDRFDPDRNTADDVQKRTIVGIVYHLGRGNELVLDYDRLVFDQAGRPADDRVQLTVQVRF